MRVIAHGSHSVRVYTLTKTSVPSTLLRCLALFPNSFSHRSFKSAQVVWWMKVWAAERISHSHWSLLDRVAIRECVCLCSCVCVCVWNVLLLVTEGVCWQLNPVLTTWPRPDLSVWLRPQSRGSYWLKLLTDGAPLLSWPWASTRACPQQDRAGRANRGGSTWPSCTDTAVIYSSFAGGVSFS